MGNGKPLAEQRERKGLAYGCFSQDRGGRLRSLRKYILFTAKVDHMLSPGCAYNDSCSSFGNRLTKSPIFFLTHDHHDDDGDDEVDAENDIEG